MPSPHTQTIRVAVEPKNPTDSEKPVEGIKNCDPNGHLTMYVCKMVPTSHRGGFHAFFPVFSDKVITSMKAPILGPKWHQERRFTRTDNSGNHPHDGSLCRSHGRCPIWKHLQKQAKLECQEVLLIFRSTCGCLTRESGRFRKKPVEGLKRLAKSDPMVQCVIEEYGEYIIAGAGDLHLEICLKTLEGDHASIEVNLSEPVVSYRFQWATKQSIVIPSVAVRSFLPPVVNSLGNVQPRLIEPVCQCEIQKAAPDDTALYK
ncbi:elongation factor 2-like [Rhynchophorus ferrugineus]|uniref:elongation factor 2-like n=1 Tax=Rhynchophorus ferrugineus TaxID=354439 RepID=UPI003FCE9A53